MIIEERLRLLEERLTWLQKHTTEQDRVISAQGFELEKLNKKIELLISKVPEVSPERAADSEKPPHY